MTLRHSDVLMGLAMKAENRGYDEPLMQMLIEKLQQEKEEVKIMILDFWHYLSGNCGFMLYCELMKRLEVEKRQSVSYLI